MMQDVLGSFNDLIEWQGISTMYQNLFLYVWLRFINSRIFTIVYLFSPSLPLVFLSSSYFSVCLSVSPPPPTVSLSVYIYIYIYKERDRYLFIHQPDLLLIRQSIHTFNLPTWICVFGNFHVSSLSPSRLPLVFLFFSLPVCLPPPPLSLSLSLSLSLYIYIYIYIYIYRLIHTSTWLPTYPSIHTFILSAHMDLRFCEFACFF